MELVGHRVCHGSELSAMTATPLLSLNWRPDVLMVLLVGTGGFFGAAMRYLIGSWVNDLNRGTWFPYGTVTVNLVGCLAIGIVAGLAEHREMFGAEARAFILIGLLGGFTTFSAFGHETMLLARNGDATAALANIALQVGFGLTAVWVGYNVSRLV